jgi:hypothetical protein
MMYFLQRLICALTKFDTARKQFCVWLICVKTHFGGLFYDAGSI